MKHLYNRAGLLWSLRRLALVALLAGGGSGARAQFFAAGNVISQAGTYADLGVSGVTISTPDFDDSNSDPQTLPFAFTYNGTVFSQFVLNTNGYLKLGSVAPAPPYFATYAQQPSSDGPLISASETNLLLPFNADLEAGTGPTEYRFATTGTAPNRICTIQWKNVSDKARPATPTTGNLDKQFANFSFQIKLYEATNNVDFVYGTATPSTGQTNANFIVIGLKGANTTAAQAITAVKPSNNAWSTTTFQAGPYLAGANGHNIRAVATTAGGTPLPDPGRTYSFLLPAANDAAVQAVYAYDQLPVPAGQPATLRAAVRNAGTGALGSLTVTLSVSGANTTTVAQTTGSLAVGATVVVTFAGVVLPNAGTNTVTVTVPNDDNNTNNSGSATLVTNATTFSYITLPGAATQGGIGNAAGTLQGFAAKFTLTAPRTLTAVRAFVTDFATIGTTQKTTVGETLYGVVVDAISGAIVARSPDYVVTTAAANALHTFNLTTPITISAGDFLVGLIQVTASAGPRFYPMGIQTETPVRPGAFYGISTATPPTAPVDVYGTAGAYGKYMLEAVTIPPSSCAPPAGVTVTGTSNSASIAFTGPANGTSYQLVYGPTGFNPASAGTTSAAFANSPGAVAGLTPATCYDFYLRSSCGTGQSALVGPFGFCTPCLAPTISTFPYAQSFDALAPGQALPCGITVADANADGFTWRVRSTVDPSLSGTSVVHSAPNAMVYVYNTDDITVGADDWFYSPALALVAGQRYRLSFYYRVAAGYTERLEVKYGPSPTPAGQTTALFANPAVTNAAYALVNNASTPAVLDFSPAAGTYYLGFHALSTASQGLLAVDDVLITASPLATSAALGRAVSVFPNPSASGLFSLEIHGAQARQPLLVEVTNLLGQRVFTGTAADNFRTELNLTLLAPGLYSLKVRNGAEFTQQQIAIVK